MLDADVSGRVLSRGQTCQGGAVRVRAGDFTDCLGFRGVSGRETSKTVALGAFSTPDVLPYGYWPRVWAERGRGCKGECLDGVAGNKNAPEPGRIERA